MYIQQLYSTILFLLVGIVFGKDYPKFLPRCKIPNPNFDKCFFKAAETVKPYLKKGIPELNLRSFEPFHVEKVHLEQTTQGGNYKTDLTDCYLHGMTNYSIDSFKIIKFTPEEYHNVVNISIPLVRVTSKYKMEGTILRVPIRASGIFNGDIANLQTLTSSKHKNKLINGLSYYKIESCDVKLTVDKKNTKVKFQSDKKESDAISQATDHFLNENISLLIDDFIPPIEEVIREISKQVIGKFYDDIPMNELFILE